MSEKTHLVEVAKGIRDWQIGHGVSDAEMVRRFGGLGSTKTYKRILEDDLEELDIERWTVEYEQVRTLLELESTSTAEDEPVYDDLFHVTAARLAVSEAITERGNNRLVIIEGQSGTGKSTAARCIAAKYGRKTVLVEADETWKGPNLPPMLGGLLRGLGIIDLPASTEERMTKLIDTLKEAPICLVIDEAHHLGPRTLNVVKSILNKTPCQIVFLCIPSIFRRLETQAYEEARQLTKNRLCKRVRLSGPSTEDVQKFFERRMKLEPDTDGRCNTLAACAKSCAEQARRYGNWNFVNLTVRECRQLAGKRLVDRETFVKAMLRVVNSR